jgi:uncharacterized membrane protein
VSLAPEVVLLILVMGIATYATRAGGCLIMRFMPLGTWMQAWLEELPGALLVAIVAPAVLTGGVPYLAGIAATFLALWLGGRELVAVAAGIAAVAALRHFS